jgi:hypothetical protein
MIAALTRCHVHALRTPNICTRIHSSLTAASYNTVLMASSFDEVDACADQCIPDARCGRGTVWPEAFDLPRFLPEQRMGSLTKPNVTSVSAQNLGRRSQRGPQAQILHR